MKRRSDDIYQNITTYSVLNNSSVYPPGIINLIPTIRYTVTLNIDNLWFPRLHTQSTDLLGALGGPIRRGSISKMSAGDKPDVLRLEGVVHTIET